MERLAVADADQSAALLLQEAGLSGWAPEAGSWPVCHSVLLVDRSTHPFGQLCSHRPEGCAGCRGSCRPIATSSHPALRSLRQSRSRISWGSPAVSRSPSSDPRLAPAGNACGGQRPEATQAREWPCQPPAPPSQPQRRNPFCQRRSPTTFTHGGRRTRFTGQGSRTAASASARSGAANA